MLICVNEVLDEPSAAGRRFERIVARALHGALTDLGENATVEDVPPNASGMERITVDGYFKLRLVVRHLLRQLRTEGYEFPRLRKQKP
jgi:hypothetical protein